MSLETQTESNPPLGISDLIIRLAWEYEQGMVSEYQTKMGYSQIIELMKKTDLFEKDFHN